MKIIRSKEFRADRAWGALDIANMNGVATRLHWTDQPYRWQANDGEEVFAVLDSQVEMLYRLDGGEHRTLLNAGDVFFAGVGCKRVARPQGRHESSWSSRTGRPEGHMDARPGMRLYLLRAPANGAESGSGAWCAMGLLAATERYATEATSLAVDSFYLVRPSGRIAFSLASGGPS